MELQNQIYVMIAVFGGLTALLLVLTVMLAVYVKKTRTLLEDYKLTDASHSNGMIDGDRRDRRRMDHTSAAQHGYPMDVFGHGMGSKADQTKARNDYMHNGRNINGNRHQASGPYRNDVEVGMGYMGGKRGVEKPMKPTPPHKPPRSQASVEDSALELEVANIFDMDELDEEDLSDFNSGPVDGKDQRYMANGADGPPGRSKRPPTNGHQYEREMGRNGANEGRANRFQNPHAAMKPKGGGNVRGFTGDDGMTGGKQNQGYFDDRGSMY
ncbi:uncharacterized protein LOC126565249 [Anopheles maculipalpis]|uniref:uncharacterized protein LOC126565249 n=1 Tax=Anopheles maculipalpis TaxID=1496333 RepID=UPI002158E06D|nr:uncharacterized protein LOC126565249 [Anopheles maculipalpis]